MSLKINWHHLDATVAEALKELVNAQVCDGLSSKIPALQSLAIADIAWGDVPPYVELLSLTASRFCSQDPGPRPPEGSAATSDEWSDALCAPEDASTSTSTLPAARRHTRPEEIDPIADIFGASGVNLRLHTTYGGGLTVRACCTVGQTLEVAPGCSVGVSLLVDVVVTDLRLDLVLNVDAAGGLLRLWADPADGPPLSWLSVAVRAGDTAAAADPCTDYDAIGGLVLSELRAALSDRFVAPHYVTVPLHG